MLWLIASLTALVIGPILYQWAYARPKTLEWVEGFVVAAVAGLVLIETVPHAFETSGASAIVVALIGFSVPIVGERLLHDSLERAHTATVALALVGIVAHGLIDGAALSLSPEPGLPLAIVLHRIPVGLMIWWLVRPGYGNRVAGGCLLGLMASTLMGFAAASELSATLSSASASLVQAFVAGTLLHVLFHQHPPTGDSEPDPHEPTHQHSALREFQNWLSPQRIGGMVLGVVCYVLLRLSRALADCS